MLGTYFMANAQTLSLMSKYAAIPQEEIYVTVFKLNGEWSHRVCFTVCSKAAYQRICFWVQASPALTEPVS